jgi:hypothetical protein
MLWIHQGSDTKGATWPDHLDAMITPIELHLSRHNSVDLFAKLSMVEDNVTLFDAKVIAFSGQRCNGIQLKICVDVHNGIEVALKGRGQSMRLDAVLPRQAGSTSCPA